MKIELGIITGMAIVTYLPRMIPFILMKDIEIPKKIDRFLSLIPYTILSALIFPGILEASANMSSSVAALATCSIAAIKGVKPTGVVLLGILTVFIFQYF
ncbi:AzlD domain-containing protein [Alkalibacter mobilis]|uniref:AzlD domain-containing protein n=1 Tax=Alkalibacter mobilis TaxID=2787712 RepID=UPI00189FDB11|nr:AzlD domain-containing protein [Alkalibacter mobilis]MBF7097717.1 AzlD domain-containing protein [Alkalibacter mobilis]